MKKNFLTKMKHSMMAILTVAAMGMMTASLAACSSSEDESEITKGETETPEHKPVESLLVKTMKEHPVSGWEYIKKKDAMVGTLELHSEAPMAGQRFDRWIIGMFLEADPGLDKWHGTYQISQVWGSVHGFVDGEFWETSKASLDTGDNVVPVKGAWIKMEDMGRKDEMGRKEYHIQLHIDELKEENGDYARDINIDITSFREPNMLEY